MVYSRQQQQALAQRLPDTPVALGMTTASPSLESASMKLLAEHVESYCGAAALSAILLFYGRLRYGLNWHAFWRANVAFRGYRLFVITPITTITLMHWRTAYALLLPNMANRICCCSLIMAFPSVMQMKAMINRNVAAQTTRELASALGMAPEKVMMTFQSALWPGTLADALYRRNAENARRKRRRSYTGDVPGFAADCLETLEEIAEQNREVFLGAGGKKYEYIPALNATPEHIEMMANLVAAYR